MKDAVTKKLNNVLNLLETLYDHDNRPIVDCLCAWSEATLVDLLIQTGMEAELLYEKLEHLLEGGLVTYDRASNAYQLCKKKLVHISRFHLGNKTRKAVIAV